jgi:hypothetical protein
VFVMVYGLRLGRSRIFAAPAAHSCSGVLRRMRALACVQAVGDLQMQWELRLVHHTNQRSRLLIGFYHWKI